MLDFVKIVAERRSKNVVFIKPTFLIKKSKDLMIRGGDFYAVWDESTGLWTTSEDVVVQIIDGLIREKYKQLNEEHPEDSYFPLYMEEASSGSIDSWHKYVQKQLRDNYVQLDSQVTFKSTTLSKDMYISRTLPYELSQGDCPAYEEIMSTLYDIPDREKLEWALGAIISGDSQSIQKFIVIYGDPGSGKGTFFKIVEKLLDGYCGSFDAKALTSNSNSFSLEDFKKNPLVSICGDAKLDRIEDNTKLNSIVSHETMSVNLKHKSTYDARFNTFLFIGTNEPVKITNAKSGIIRRLIDVYPSGRKIPHAKYDKLLSKVDFELGAVAFRCLEVYNQRGKYYYDKYIPYQMIQVTNDFYNFVEDMYDSFRLWDQVTLDSAWGAYLQWNTESNNKFPLNKRAFKAELKNYFDKFEERAVSETGKIQKNLYSGFRWQKFVLEPLQDENPIEPAEESWLKLTETVSILDSLLANNPAQYVLESGAAEKKWADNTKKLKDIDTRRLHFVLLQDTNHIVIDFDADDLETNLKNASMWPPTYAEFSKSGFRIHLHYFYDGDPLELDAIYAEHVEQKVYPEDKKMALRRKLSFCNNLPIAHISSGLKLKEEKERPEMISTKVAEDEAHLRNKINKALRKEVHAHTKENVNYIKKVLDDAYYGGMSYDVRDMEGQVTDFGLNATNSASECLSLIIKMHFCSKDREPPVDFNNPTINFDDEYEPNAPYAIYDVEVFENLFILCYQVLGTSEIIGLINPSPAVIEELFFPDRVTGKRKYKWGGFNSINYDDQIVYLRYIGGTNLQLYDLSQRLIDGQKGAKNYNARISFFDIFDFSSKKQSLKKWQNAMAADGKDVIHKELGIPWDKPVPESMWEQVMQYCKNDVASTVALFYYENKEEGVSIPGDFKAREILVAIVNAIRGPGSQIRDTSNALTIRLITGDKENPQAEFNYPDLSQRFPGYQHKEFDTFPIEMYKSKDEYVNGHAIYKGVDPGYGGRVFARPGIYTNVTTCDVASMHPTSLEQEMGFGPEMTPIYSDLKKLRIAIKHKDYDLARTFFNGAAAPFLEDPDDAKALAQALKIVINSVYGLTSAKFPNRLRDPRNVDNWVAKRGALFMIDLQEAVEAMGYKVVHIKTDSIKIANSTPEIEEFIFEFGFEYGYSFEIEDRFERFCLVNESTYVALDVEGKWHTTGKEFAVPYVKKMLFTHEPITFNDLCELKSVKSAMYLDMNEDQDVLRDVYESDYGNNSDITVEELPDGSKIYHNYVFVGKTGRFIPVKAGSGGGILVRKNENTGKMDAVTGTKKKHPIDKNDTVYRWIEAETFDDEDTLESIDMQYWDDLAKDAIDHIEEFGSYTEFVTTELGHYNK